MKKTISFIILFIICAIFVLVGTYSDCKFAIWLGVIFSAILGSVASILIDALDTYGQGVKLWFQAKKYYNDDVRLSFSYLFRIEIDGKYVLVKGNRINNRYQPIGGVYKYYDEAKPTLDKFAFKPDVKMKNYDETDDLRITIKGKYILKYMNWFLRMEDREYDPYREFKEELLDSKILPEDEFKILKYRKVFVHNNGITFSKYLQCNELLFSDIFELKLTEHQKNLFRQAINNSPDKLCLVSADDIERESRDGIINDISNNSRWLLGE